MIQAGEAQLMVSGFDSPEGPAFDRDGNLFFVNWLTSSINRLDTNGNVTEFFNTGGIPAGLAFHPDGCLWVADEGDDIHGLMRITPDGQAQIVVNEYEGRPLNGANDLVIDRNGVIYFSDPWRSSAENPIGGFYRYFPDGRLERIDTGLAFPNGVALNANESAVYLAETYKTRILRYEIHADGSVGPAEEWGQTGDPPGPDGMAFDAEGNLCCAHHDGGQSRHLRSRRRANRRDPDPGRRRDQLRVRRPGPQDSGRDRRHDRLALYRADAHSGPAAERSLAAGMVVRNRGAGEPLTPPGEELIDLVLLHRDHPAGQLPDFPVRRPVGGRARQDDAAAIVGDDRVDVGEVDFSTA